MSQQDGQLGIATQQLMIAMTVIIQYLVLLHQIMGLEILTAMDTRMLF